MATIVNERDVLLRGSASRSVEVTLPSNVVPSQLRGIELQAPASTFRVAPDGQPTPAAITLTATLKGIAAGTPVTWTVTSGVVNLSGSGLTRTVPFSGMPTDFITVKVSVEYNGMTYEDSLSLQKVYDGDLGAPGVRGSLTVVKTITGSVWSDVEALSAIMGEGVDSPLATDTCTLVNVAANYSEMRRYNGSAWVPIGVHVPGSALMPRSITTEKLVVTSFGSALNADPNTEDVTAWTGGGISIQTDTSAPNGTSVLRCEGIGTAVLSKKFPIDSTQSHRVRTWVKQLSGTSTMYLVVAFYDANGTAILGSSSPSGWTSTGTYHYYGIVLQSAPSTWTEFSTSFGAGEVKGVPAGAKYASIGLISNYTGGAGVQLVSGMICHLKATGEMVVDGSLKARHIVSDGLSVRSATGRVLLSAEGDAVPPWLTDLSVPNDRGISLLKPADSSTNTRQLRTLVPGSGLKASISQDGNFYTIQSVGSEVSYTEGGSGTSTGASAHVDILPERGFDVLSEMEIEVAVRVPAGQGVKFHFHTGAYPGGYPFEWMMLGALVVDQEYPSAVGTFPIGASYCQTSDGAFTNVPIPDEVITATRMSTDPGGWTDVKTFSPEYSPGSVKVSRFRFKVFHSGPYSGFTGGYNVATPRLRVSLTSANEGYNSQLLWSRIRVSKVRQSLTVTPAVLNTISLASNSGSPGGTVAYTLNEDTFQIAPNQYYEVPNMLGFYVEFSPFGTYRLRVYKAVYTAEGPKNAVDVHTADGNWSSSPGSFSGVEPGDMANIGFEVVNDSGYPYTNSVDTAVAGFAPKAVTGLDVTAAFGGTLAVLKPILATATAHVKFQLKVNLYADGASAPHYIDTINVDLRVNLRLVTLGF